MGGPLSIQNTISGPYEENASMREILQLTGEKKILYIERK